MPDDPLRRFGRVLLGLSVICIAAICFYNNDFAGQREPVPLGLPLRSALIELNIVILAGAGVALVSRSWQHYGAVILAIYLAFWTLFLHVPKVFVGEVAAWLGAAECFAIAVAAVRVAQWPGDQGYVAHAINAAFAICLFAFGAAHFIYVDITASMVPSFLPARRLLAYFTGAAQIAAGISIVTRTWPLWATRLLATMFASFTLLVNMPMAWGKSLVGPSALDVSFAMALTASATIMASSNWARKV